MKNHECVRACVGAVVFIFTHTHTCVHVNSCLFFFFFWLPHLSFFSSFNLHGQTLYMSIHPLPSFKYPHPYTTLNKNNINNLPRICNLYIQLWMPCTCYYMPLLLGCLICYQKIREIFPRLDEFYVM